jgi:hypothetical protein
VLERVTTNDDIGLEVLVLFRKKVGDEANLVARRQASLVGPVAGIDAEPRSTAHITKLPEEFAFAATDLNDMLAGYRALLGSFAGQLPGKRIENAGEVLGFLEVGRVPHHSFIENVVEHEAAGVAAGELQVSPSQSTRRLGCIQENAAMNRNRRYAV